MEFMGGEGEDFTVCGSEGGIDEGVVVVACINIAVAFEGSGGIGDILFEEVLSQAVAL
jgi:hypothetical protein